ncbi:MAG: alpha-2-macroglobulin family protein, partial [Candidatus Hodarchaeota archaeon]
MSEKVLQVFALEYNIREFLSDLIDLQKKFPRIHEALTKFETWGETPQLFIRYDPNVEVGQKWVARIIVLDDKFKPMPGVSVKVSSGDILLQELTSDETGACTVTLDPLKPGYAESLSFEAKSGSHVQKTTLTLNSKEVKDAVIYILTDRDVYDPQTKPKLLIRLLNWLHVGSKYIPAEDVEVVVSFIDPKGFTLYRKTLKSDSFGITDYSIALSDELEEGNYILKVESGNSSYEKSIKIERIKKPFINLKVECDPKFCILRQKMTLNVTANYFWGDPVKDGKVQISIIDLSKKEVAKLEGITDQAGKLKLETTVESGKIGDGKIAAKCIDSVDRKVERDFPIKIASRPFNIKLNPREIHSGRKVLFTIQVSWANDEPASDIKVNTTYVGPDGFPTFGQNRTDDGGFARFEVDFPEVKAAEKQKIILTLEGEGHCIHLKERIDVLRPRKEELKVAVSSKSKNEEKELSITVTPEATVVSDTAIISIKSTFSEPLPIFLDLSKEGLIRHYSGIMKNGTIDFNVDIGSDLWGKIDVYAYTIITGGYLKDTFEQIYIHPKSKELQVIIDGQDEFAPGDHGVFQISVKNQAGVELLGQTMLGIAVVDSAIRALGKPRDPIHKLFFNKEYPVQESVENFSWSRKFLEKDGIDFLNLLIHYCHLNPEAILATLHLLYNAGKLDFIAPDQMEQLVINLFKAITASTKENETPIFYLAKGTVWVTEKDLEDYLKSVLTPWFQSRGANATDFENVINDLKKAFNQNLLSLTVLSNVFRNFVNTNMSRISRTKKLKELLASVIDLINQHDEEKGKIVDTFIKAMLSFGGLAKDRRIHIEGMDDIGSVLGCVTGSYYTKIGYVGESKPKMLIETLIGFPKYTSIMTDVDHYVREHYSGGGVSLDDDDTGETASTTSKLGLVAPKKSPRKKKLGKKTTKEPEEPEEKKEPKVTIRTKFFETCCWLPQAQATDGKYQLDVDLPDTIGSHEIAVLASTAECEAGLGLKEIVVRQDFFVQPDLPASITLGDNFTFPILITNRTDEDIETNVTATSDVLELKALASSQQAIVPAKGTAMSLWTVKTIAEKCTEGEITVEASSKKFIDKVIKRVLIEPPTEPIVNETNFALIDTNETAITLPFDSDAIKSSVSLSVIPSILSGALDGLEALISYEHGCCEQIASRMLANAVFYQYLQNTNQITPELQIRTEAIFSEGVQTLISRRNSNGSWTYFREAEDFYITAHVLKTFIEIQKAGFFIDQRVIIDGASWLNESAKNGRWTHALIGYTFLSEFGLTAKIADVLLEIFPPGNVLSTLDFLEEKMVAIRDPFERSLACLVLHKAGRDVSGYLKALIDQAKTVHDS